MFIKSKCFKILMNGVADTHFVGHSGTTLIQISNKIIYIFKAN